MEIVHDDETRHASRASGKSGRLAVGDHIAEKSMKMKWNYTQDGVDQLLTQLLEKLVRVRDRPDPADALHGPPVERREDEEFIYLEVGLPGVTGPDIDICIHEGRAFIRMERPPAGPTPPS
jgi:HSP20 family molecular chaperone IbpA